MFEKELSKYAELAVKVGVNIQKNQLAVIHSDIENKEFAHLVQKAAYKAGAANVIIDWTDQESQKQFLLHGDDEVLETFPKSEVERYKEWHQANATFIHLITEKPHSFNEIDPKRVSVYNKVKRKSLEFHYNKVYSNQVRWCLIIVPNPVWAQQVFPDLSADMSMESLWESILTGARATGKDPIKDWKFHDQSFKTRLKYLNEQSFKSLKFTNSLGTNLMIGLPKNHCFLGGGCQDSNGVTFFPNIPTEEIFTAPHRDQVNGKLVGTKPLIFENQIIDEFELVFEQGKIVRFSAKHGKEALASLIAYDEGTSYLGEIALVSTKTPLFELNKVFYNTLFDENTACHIGIGGANPSNLINGEKLSQEELVEAGLNASTILINATFGSVDMRVEGIKANGEVISLIKSGDFCF